MKTKLFLGLLAGLAPLAWTAGLEDLRPAQLPGLTAGSIPGMARPLLPLPELVKLDMCVLSEMKNDKCYFKCESGAVTTEPAVRPDFGAGEPAGPCAPYITRQIKVFAAAGKKSLRPDQLKDLLNDADPEVRKAAVRSARSHVQNSYAADRVLEILKDKNERADIRVEAARTLSYAPGYVKTQDALVDLLKYGSNEPAALRVMAYKALWAAAAANPRYMDFLIDAVKYSEKDAAARRAAVWALSGAAASFRAQQLLVDLLKYGNETEVMKIEAIKSLYGAVGVFAVKDLFQDIVGSGLQPRSARLAALKALSALTADTSVQRFITDLIRSERDQELRVAAVEAANPDMAALREFFHLGYNVENGGFVSPIEKE